jgi:hypothetical protein
VTQQPSIGDLVYLASYLIRVRVSAQNTPPDTPNQYTADLKVMGDQGAMVLDALEGPPGSGGQQTFAFRQQDDAYVNSSADLPTNLTDLPADIGKYFLIDTLDSEGMVTMETAWTWYGTAWRQFMLGTFGPPGPVPAIEVEENLIPPGEDAYVDTTATTTEPSWDLYLPEPAGPVGPVGPLHNFPDVDTSTAPKTFDLLAFNGKYNTAGQPIWAPFAINQLLPGPYSMPESAFTAFTGLTQQALIGSYTIPGQPFEWTPIVWGHLGMTGINLSKDPLLIGAQVLMGDPVSGVQIARGIGSTLGRVVIYPHYTTTANKALTVTPTNQYAMVAANTAATIHVNLWNDGQQGLYSFHPGGAQLFVMATPVNIAAQFAAGGG